MRFVKKDQFSIPCAFSTRNWGERETVDSAHEFKTLKTITKQSAADRIRWAGRNNLFSWVGRLLSPQTRIWGLGLPVLRQNNMNTMQTQNYSSTFVTSTVNCWDNSTRYTHSSLSTCSSRRSSCCLDSGTRCGKSSWRAARNSDVSYTCCSTLVDSPWRSDNHRVPGGSATSVSMCSYTRFPAVQYITHGTVISRLRSCREGGAPIAEISRSRAAPSLRIFEIQSSNKLHVYRPRRDVSSLNFRTVSIAYSQIE